MKPGPFAYHAPETLGDAVRLLTEIEDAKVLAGGQSLVPMLNFRIAQPAALVDLNAIPGLAYVRQAGARLEVGASTRQRTLELDERARAAIPVLGELMGHIGHVAIRHRGTVGGSIAHADPAAELPLLALALDAELVVEGPRGRRTIAAEDFFVSYLTTALEPDEILVEVRFGLVDPGSGQAFDELARRHGDFAIASALVIADVAHDGSVDECRVAVGGVDAVPRRVRAAEAELTGSDGSAEAIARAADAVSSAVAPLWDAYAGADYRRHVASVVAARTIDAAIQRARREGA